MKDGRQDWGLYCVLCISALRYSPFYVVGLIVGTKIVWKCYLNLEVTNYLIPGLDLITLNIWPLHIQNDFWNTVDVACIWLFSSLCLFFFLPINFLLFEEEHTWYLCIIVADASLLIHTSFFLERETDNESRALWSVALPLSLLFPSGSVFLPPSILSKPPQTSEAAVLPHLTLLSRHDRSDWCCPEKCR